MSLVLQSLETRAMWGCLTHGQRPTRCTYLFCSSSFSCRSWPISERIPRSVLERELIWLRSSCSTCLLACRSAFNFLMSCSSLGEGETQHLHHWEATPGTLRETLAEVPDCWVAGGAPCQQLLTSTQLPSAISLWISASAWVSPFPPEGNFWFPPNICEHWQVKMVPVSIWAANKGGGEGRGRVPEGHGPLPTGEFPMPLSKGDMLITTSSGPICFETSW